MNIPRIEDVSEKLDAILENYCPTSLKFLDSEGNWLTNPQNLRDRISNELLYEIWRTSSEPGYNGDIGSLIRPLIVDENSWAVALAISNMVSTRKRGQNDLLIILEALYRFIEFEVYKINSEIFVSVWDHNGKRIKKQYAKKTDEFLKKLIQSSDRADSDENFLNILESLKKPSTIFGRVSQTIAEEDRIRRNFDNWISVLKRTSRKEEIYNLLGEQVSTSLLKTTDLPRALLRPCLELLDKRDIEISSGLQLEAATTLGALEDIRSTDRLLDSLEKTDRKHTNLRTCLIYALGNLRQRKTVDYLSDILKGPDNVIVDYNRGPPGYKQTLVWEKREAIWALGKLGINAAKAVHLLSRYAETSDREIKLALAWAMGVIGEEQRKKHSGISAEIIITLLRLLTDADTAVFEESAFSLKRLGLPDFVHSLYLRNAAKIPILSLKPSATGLYELSETLIYLLSLKKTVVMAVTGDSGTGKTYFCESIIEGFGQICAEDILYLQRDNPAYMKSFDRMLGSEYLKKHVDSQLYDYYLPSDKEDTNTYFDEFIDKHKDKRLIILDGWRDDAYFEKIIEIFYKKGYLDITVNFRATYSTKRLNLEARESTLERVTSCLSCVENPLEETRFYSEGKVLIYNLDNSIPSRLNEDEIIEVFRRRKVEKWGDYIRIGIFEKDVRPLEISTKRIPYNLKKIPARIADFSMADITPFTPIEFAFTRTLNDDIENEPNLLQSIYLDEIDIERISFYTPGQIAFCGLDGSVGILFGLNDKALYAYIFESKPVGIATVGSDICSIDSEGNLKIVSLLENEHKTIRGNSPPACAITSNRVNLIVTGHIDGSIRLWDTKSARVEKIKAHATAVTAIAIDRGKRIASVSEDNGIFIWDIIDNNAAIFDKQKGTVRAVDIYPDGRIATTIGDNKIVLVNPETGDCEVFHFDNPGSIITINSYFDGRILIGFRKAENKTGGSLVVLNPYRDFVDYAILPGHRLETRDCITMGPRIITCGSDKESVNTLRIWSTESYVRNELEKLKLLPDSTQKPPFYRTLF